MRLPYCFLTTLLLALPATAAAQQTKGVPASAISWKKTVIDRTFLSEGVAIADVNKDGKMDILTGEHWYEAPTWKRHEIRKPPRDYGDGLKGYSESFLCWTDDINHDGWLDLIVIRFPGQPCHWYENPKGQPGHWKEHVIWHSACNETPQYVDLFGNGRRVLIMGWQPQGQERQGQMAWFRPGPDPTQPWEMHPISKPSEPGKEVPGTQRYSHGLGVGDVNGDGRLDVICTGGWWEQPAQPDGQPWAFHPANLGEAAADMHCYDLDGDGKMDIISSSAHKFGIWAHQQRAGKNGDPAFLKQDLFRELFSESHALHVADINGDGLPDLITGKRWWSHGRSEPGSDWPAVLYWFEARRGSDGIIKFIPHQIDDDSGIGTQFVVADFNGDGLLDIVTSNKKGTYLFEQVRTAPVPEKKAVLKIDPEKLRRLVPLLLKARNPYGLAPAARSLFNGRDFTGWDTWLGHPPGEKEPIGLNKDPRGVYSVQTVDGKPAIRISGEVWGALTSREEFENYHLKLEFKWGEKRWKPREDKKRDSGLLYHCVGPHGAHGSFWMQSLECQIQEGDTGDFWSVAGVTVDVESRYQDADYERNPGGLIVWQRGGPKLTVPRRVPGPDGKPRTDPRIIRSADYEKPTGEWNTVELFTVGSTSVHVVNGKVNLVMTNARRKVDGKEVPLTRGKIQLQSEGAEVSYRNITLQTISQIPAEYVQ